MFEALAASRVVATAETMDALSTPADAIVLLIAPDEAVVIGAAPGEIAVDDEHAIVVADGGWQGIWIDAADSERLVAAGADWSPREERPTLAQGMLFHLPVKLWIETDRTLVLIQHVAAADLATRIGGTT